MFERRRHRWSRHVTARSFEPTGFAVGSGCAAAPSFPTPFGFTRTPITLRFAGTGMNAFNWIAERNKEDLSFGAAVHDNGLR